LNIRPLIVTMGDPTGIGPELILRCQQAGNLSRRPLLVAGDAQVLHATARSLGLKARLTSHGDEQRLCWNDQQLRIRSLSHLNSENLRPGQPDSACGRAMADYVEWAIAACRSEKAAAMITCPINKAAINLAGCQFPGHTELLAARCGCSKVVMMLAGSRLRVSLVTTHTALCHVPALLSSAEIFHTIRITDESLRTYFGLPQPRLAVLALNPHAGEQGLFGDEEQRLIQPAIEQARRQGINLSGPHSADTLFYFAARGDYDAVVCMYHDQGLIPLKLLHFDDAVNLTLGLPIIRTSVDHGTAYDLVGTGRANIASLQAAIRLADQMATKRKN
jgi:4-hydroxythreonine-4-phosphate dehydrogenase